MYLLQLHAYLLELLVISLTLVLLNVVPNVLRLRNKNKNEHYKWWWGKKPIKQLLGEFYNPLYMVL